MKSDASIRNICLAAAKRKVMKPFESKFTTIFETDTMAEIGSLIYFLTAPEEYELPICQTLIDNYNWTLVTTRKITTCKNGAQNSVKVAEFKIEDWGHFKGHGKIEHTVGLLISDTNRTMEFFIETGRISMIMVSVTKALINIA